MYTRDLTQNLAKGTIPSMEIDEGRFLLSQEFPFIVLYYIIAW